MERVTLCSNFEAGFQFLGWTIEKGSDLRVFLGKGSCTGCALHKNTVLSCTGLGALDRFLVAQMVRSLPAMQETWVWSLGQEDPLEKEMTTHSNILAWKIPWTEEPGRLKSMGSQRIWHDWVYMCTHTTDLLVSTLQLKGTILHTSVTTAKYFAFTNLFCWF